MYSLINRYSQAYIFVTFWEMQQTYYIEFFYSILNLFYFLVEIKKPKKNNYNKNNKLSKTENISTSCTRYVYKLLCIVRVYNY